MVVEEVVLNVNIRRLKRLTRDVLQHFQDINAFTLPFNGLDHIGEDVSRFGALNFLDASPYKNFKFLIKKPTRIPTVRRRKTHTEPLRVINKSVGSDET